MRRLTTGMTSSCKLTLPWWKLSPPPALKTPQPGREHEVEVGVVAEVSAGNPHGARRRGAAVPHPTAAVNVDRVPARVVGLHVVMFADRELVPMVRGNDEVFDASRGELTDGPCHIADDALHGRTRGQFVDALAKGIDFLRAYDHQ